VPEGFRLDAVARSHGWYDLPPFAYDRAAARLSVAAEHEGRAVALVFSEGPRGLTVESSPPAPAAKIREWTARIFSLGLDLAAFYDRTDGDAELGWARARGAGRMLRAPSLWEDAVKMLLTTNCSWAATRGMVERSIAELGTGGAFPGPMVIAASTEKALRAKIRCGYRAPSLLRFARRVAKGQTVLARWEDANRSSEDVRAAILEEPGFGPYAAEALLRLLGRHDFFAHDSWTRKKYRGLHPGRGSVEISIARRYGRYGKFRGLAYWLDLTRDWGDEKI